MPTVLEPQGSTFLPATNTSKLRAKPKPTYPDSTQLNPNRHPSTRFFFVLFITHAEETIARKQFAVLHETKAREAFLGKIILRNHQQPIPALQTPILNKRDVINEKGQIKIKSRHSIQKSRTRPTLIQPTELPKRSGASNSLVNTGP